MANLACRRIVGSGDVDFWCEKLASKANEAGLSFAFLFLRAIDLIDNQNNDISKMLFM